MFRFFDARIALAFMATLGPADAVAFFGPVDALVTKSVTGATRSERKYREEKCEGKRGLLLRRQKENRARESGRRQIRWRAPKKQPRIRHKETVEHLEIVNQ